ncbi:MAG: hypothetical protein K1Y02_26190 [Candidatus Hydrogenedentes bacterium]|nr:hypothetical protein [Candidatus Hydrogenedentota bacterium]
MATVTAGYSDPVIQPCPHFCGARDHTAPQDRLKAIVEACKPFRDELMSGDPVPYYQSFDLIRAPYPRRYALKDACTIPIPFVHILNRMFVVQFRSQTGLKTMLVSPSDYRRNAETPFFKHLTESFGAFRTQLEPLMAPELGTVETWLAQVGIRPEQIDYITYDHLHTQDIRRWLGTPEIPAYFPNAKLLVMRQEWESTKALLPPQKQWYCPEGIEGVPAGKIVLLDGDVILGSGVALVHTPGHTEGNHSIVVHVPEGLFVTSENGVGGDSYAPLNSRIPGLRKYAQTTGIDVILNSNTLERGLDQYISMIQEREIAGPSPRNPDFHNVVNSSELTAYWMFPGIVPTFAFGPVQFGSPEGART